MKPNNRKEIRAFSSIFHPDQTLVAWHASGIQIQGMESDDKHAVQEFPKFRNQRLNQADSGPCCEPQF